MKRRATVGRRGTIFGLLVALALLVAACQGASDPPAGASADAGAAQDTSSPASGPETGQAVDPEGHELFMTYCAKCHGPGGLGDGPSVGSLRTQAGMNLTVLKDRSDEELLTTISLGKGTEMPPWGLILTLEERETLVKYLRTLSSQ